MTDVRNLLRLLEPLMPEEARKWRRVVESGDAETAALVEQHVRSVARRVLGEPGSRPLLSLPSEGIAKGPIKLGTIIYEKEKWPLGISPDELLQHVLIAGRSGSGKTNLLAHLLGQLTDRRVPWLFLDVKRTARDLIPALGQPVQLFTAGRNLHPLPFNPFVAPPGLEAIVHMHHVVDVLSEAFALGDGARSLILRILSAALEHGEPALTPYDLVQRLDALAVTGREHAWRSSARRALQSLVVSGLSARNAGEQGSFLNSLLTNNTIIELDALSAGARKFLVPLLLLDLYHVGLLSGHRETLQIAVALDESHHYFLNGPRRAREPLMHTIMRQCREMGMALILAGQTPSATAPVARGNTFTTVVMNTKDPADTRVAAGLLGLDQEQREWLPKLPVGHAVIRLSGRWTRPVLVSIPLLPIRKGSMRDGDIRRLLADAKEQGLMKPPPPNTDGASEIRTDLAGEPLRADELRYLVDVAEHPTSGVRERNARLGLSGHMGNKLKRRLLRLGWLESQVMPMGNTRLLLLRLTPHACRALGFKEPGSRHESVVHAYWKRWYAGKYAALGYNVHLEAPRHGGFVDVLVVKGDETIGIEIETGASDVVANVRNCLRSGFVRVVVACVGVLSAVGVEKALVAEGLLIPMRVTIDQAAAPPVHDVEPGKNAKQTNK